MTPIYNFSINNNIARNILFTRNATPFLKIASILEIILNGSLRIIENFFASMNLEQKCTTSNIAWSQIVDRGNLNIPGNYGQNSEPIMTIQDSQNLAY